MKILVLGILLLSPATEVPAEDSSMRGYSGKLLTTSLGARGHNSRTAVLSSAATNRRLDYFDAGQPTSSIIQTAGIDTVLNHSRKTFYSPALPVGAGSTVRLAQPPWALSPRATLTINTLSLASNVERDILEARPIELQRLTLSFEIKDKLGGEKLVATVTAQLDLWTCEALEPVTFALSKSLITNFPEIDTAVAELLKRVDGSVLKSNLDISRSVGNGPPSLLKLTSVLHDLRAVDIDPDTFSVPDGYRFEEPSYTAPNL